jgi:glycosyltransferase involved in cell wall biosynthesis
MARILLVREFEPLPIYPEAKKLRTGMLADALLAHGHDVTWFTSTFNHLEKKYHYNTDKKIDLSYHYHFIFAHVGEYDASISLSRIRHHKLLAKKLREHLNANKESYDLVVASHPTIETCYESVIFGQLNHIPVIVDVRDMWPDTFTDYMPWYIRPFVRLAIQNMHKKTIYSFFNATVLTSMSQFVLNWAVKKSNRHAQTAAFYLGSSLDKLDASSKTNEVNSDDSNRLICTYVGGLIRSYDLSTMIQASLKLSDDMQFNIVGDGPMRDNFESLPHGENLAFKGWCEKEQVASYLKEADILVLPVIKQADPNMPNKLFDYLWAGKPILACIHGEAADLIRDYDLGYVYEHNNLEDFLKGLNYLKSSERRSEISNNIKWVYADRFQSERIYEQFVELINLTLMSNKHPHKCID